jgi:hypothetical protein
VINKKRYRVRDERGFRVKKETHDLVCNFAWQCVKELSKSKYELDILGVRFRIKTKANNSHSYYLWGREEVHIDVTSFQAGKTYFHEYRAFQNDKRISDIQYAEPTTCLLADVAHEIAHYVQYNHAMYVRRFMKTYEKSHGECFKDLYRYLRVALVNPLVAQDVVNCQGVTA